MKIWKSYWIKHVMGFLVYAAPVNDRDIIYYGDTLNGDIREACAESYELSHTEKLSQ